MTTDPSQCPAGGQTIDVGSAANRYTGEACIQCPECGDAKVQLFETVPGQLGYRIARHRRID